MTSWAIGIGAAIVRTVPSSHTQGRQADSSGLSQGLSRSRYSPIAGGLNRYHLGNSSLLGRCKCPFRQIDIHGPGRGSIGALAHNLRGETDRPRHTLRRRVPAQWSYAKKSPQGLRRSGPARVSFVSWTAVARCAGHPFRSGARQRWLDAAEPGELTAKDAAMDAGFAVLTGSRGITARNMANCRPLPRCAGAVSKTHPAGSTSVANETNEDPFAPSGPRPDLSNLGSIGVPSNGSSHIAPSTGTCLAKSNPPGYRAAADRLSKRLRCLVHNP